MKNKILIFYLSLIIVLSLSGCGVKFVQKAPEESINYGGVSEESKSNLGEITETEDVESTEESTEESVDRSNITTINDIDFEMKENTIQVYLLDDAQTFKNPLSDAEVFEELLKGEPLELMAISSDNTWAMIKHFNGPISYVKMENISYTYVRPNPNTENSESTEDTENTESTESTKDTSESSESTEKTESTQSTTTSSTESTATTTTATTTTTESIDYSYTTGGIPYPSNPASTSINLGVTFADVDMVLTVTYNGATANSGPGKVTTSTGYEVKATFSKGSTVYCTGIGENGYCRIELANGTIAFVDGKYLEQ